jgi:hypothetical protein
LTEVTPGIEGWGESHSMWKRAQSIRSGRPPPNALLGLEWRSAAKAEEGHSEEDRRGDSCGARL